MRSERLFLLAALAGIATFAAALYFQYFEGLPPCKLCMWQRYGLGVGIFGALLGAVLSGGGAIMGGAVGVIGYAAEAGAAVYHTGVERKWWPGPDTCSGNGGIGTSFDPALLGQSLTKGAPPQCDEIPWDFLGLSMANWNVAIATALALVCLIALRQRSSAAR